MKIMSVLYVKTRGYEPTHLVISVLFNFTCTPRIAFLYWRSASLTTSMLSAGWGVSSFAVAPAPVGVLDEDPGTIPALSNVLKSDLISNTGIAGATGALGTSGIDSGIAWGYAVCCG